jgi:hypothetical protein
MNPKRTTLLFLCLLMFLPVAAVQAAVVEGVELPAKIQREGEVLYLNGAGVREKFFFDIYVAGLYLPERQSDAAAILAQDQPWRMVMHFLYRKVSREKMLDGWEEGFAANLEPQRLERLRPEIDRFEHLFPDMRRGDRVLLDYQPGKGVTVTLDGKQLGVVGGRAFASALLAIWLGDEPVTESLKKALLGRK